MVAEQAVYGAQSPKDGEELCFPGPFCLEGHMYLKSRVSVSLPLFPVLPPSPCPLPLFPSLPCSIPASPTETPRYTGLSPEGGSTSLSFPSDPKHGKHPSPSSSLSLPAKGERHWGQAEWSQALPRHSSWQGLDGGFHTR